MQYMNRERPLTPEEKRKRAEEREAREQEISQKNKRLGLMIFQGSWIMVFICLIVAYWQLGFTPGWIPSPELAPNPLLPALATIALLASGWFGHRAWRAAEKRNPQADSRAKLLRPLQITIGLAALFTLIMISQFFAVPAGNTAGEQFGMIYRLMIGYHLVHAVVIGGMLVQVWRLAREGRYHHENYWAVEGVVKLWDFVIVAWMLFFVVLYVPFLL